MTECADCGSAVSASSCRVWIDPDGRYALVLCRKCSTGRPGNRQYGPLEVPNSSRITIAGRGRT